MLVQQQHRPTGQRAQHGKFLTASSACAAASARAAFCASAASMSATLAYTTPRLWKSTSSTCSSKVTLSRCAISLTTSLCLEDKLVRVVVEAITWKGETITTQHAIQRTIVKQLQLAAAMQTARATDCILAHTYHTKAGASCQGSQYSRAEHACQHTQAPCSCHMLCNNSNRTCCSMGCRCWRWTSGSVACMLARSLGQPRRPLATSPVRMTGSAASDTASTAQQAWRTRVVHAQAAAHAGSC
jgi:hypothetical protein